MSYQAIVREEDDLFIKSIYKLLKVKPGDKISWDLKDETIQVKKIDDSIPVSCRCLTEEELSKELLKAIESVKRGETIPAKEVDRIMAEMDEI